jgi:hypothetical protein
MGNTPPKFGVGVLEVRCGVQSAVKVPETDKWMEKDDHVGTRRVRPWGLPIRA